MNTKQIIINIIFLLMIVSLYKCEAQSNANFKTIGADTIKPREERLGGYNKLFLKKPDNIYVNVETQNEDSTLRNWVGNVAKKSVVFDTSKFIPYSDTVVQVLTPWNTNFKSIVRYNSDTLIYYPNQTSYTASIYIGNGGRKITTAGGNNGKYNTVFGKENMVSATTANTITSFGYNALNKLTTGSNNVAFGAGSQRDMTAGSFNASFGTSLQSTTTGSYNMTFGYWAGRYGNFNNSVLIGAQAGAGTINKGLNQTGIIKIGYSAGITDTTNNSLYIENSNSQTPLIGGKFDTDQLGVNMPIGNAWNYTLNVGGEIGATKINISDTTGATNSVAARKDWVLARLGGTGNYIPFSDTSVHVLTRNTGYIFRKNVSSTILNISSTNSFPTNSSLVTLNNNISNFALINGYTSSSQAAIVLQQDGTGGGVRSFSNTSAPFIAKSNSKHFSFEAGDGQEQAYITQGKFFANVDTTSSVARQYMPKNWILNQLAVKQNLLVSGTNIKTINGNSVLGSGDLIIGTSANLPRQTSYGPVGTTLSTYAGVNANVVSSIQAPESGYYLLTYHLDYVAPDASQFTNASIIYCKLFNRSNTALDYSNADHNLLIYPINVASGPFYYGTAAVTTMIYINAGEYIDLNCSISALPASGSIQAVYKYLTLTKINAS